MDIEVAEKESAKFFHSNRLKSKLIAVEFGDSVTGTGGAKTAVLVVAPGMIGTDDPLHVAIAVQEQLVPAVLADIEETAQPTVVVPNKEHVLINDATRHVVAGVRKL